MMAGIGDDPETWRKAADELNARLSTLQEEQDRLDQAVRALTMLDQDKRDAELAKVRAERERIDSELRPAANNYEKGIKELDKLDAEKARLDAETERIEFELRPTANNYGKGIKELDKLDAEKARLDAEKEKIEFELRPTANNYQKGVKELDKLDAEKARLDAEKERIEFELRPTANNYQKGVKELDKLDAERAKLEAERSKIQSDKFVEWFKTIGAIGLAAAAILTSLATTAKNEVERDARFRADAAHLIESLGAEKAQQRAAAAVGLRSFLNDNRTHALVIGSLAYGIGLETQIVVQQAMAESLVEAGTDAAVPLRQMLSRANGEVKIGLSKIGDVKKCGDHEQELEPIRARQNAMVAAVLALARIGRTQPSFSELNFRCYEFYRVSGDLRRAVFKDAILEHTDFFRMDLRGFNFQGADAWKAQLVKCNLTGVSFASANLESADLTEADLTNVDFGKAVLDYANFDSASGLTEPQIKMAASMHCSKFAPALAQNLARETQPSPGKTCSP
jgi:pentapeptide repeat protein